MAAVGQAPKTSDTAKAAPLCERCHATGFVGCARCRGCGHVLDGKGNPHTCPDCAGTAFMKCPACGGTGGYPDGRTRTRV